ncbi:MAG: sugar transporter substrate-binding protein [Devosia sp.]|uniref:ABC transporter substrate-binding protein n=1 Tax=Devosia sp. TaxID=1871048 RepID=UPI002612E221|nr:sugar ABC transporter substrate-binding protein [Devosia sp.]MDB5541676.1 sugar transporter substrate-binding protein [Devosia sp.]
MRLLPLLAGAMLVALAGSASAATITIATVNNNDMIRMQKLADDFTTKNPDIQLQWVTLEENVLRQRVTTDIATKGGQYDVMTIGNYEVPIWAKQGWLVDLSDLGADYNVDDLLPPIRGALSMDNKLYASPFYGESSMVHYRKDLMEKAGLTMPASPTWDFIKEAADKMTDRTNDINGICLRGKAGWGENMAFLTSMANSMGARWFDEQWHPQFDQPEWKAALQYYVDIMKADGPAGASSNGYNENLALFQQGKCGMWIDATVAAAALADPAQSTVADKLAWAVSPSAAATDNHGNWLWAWTLAIPSSSQNIDAAKKFIDWATGPSYVTLVAGKDGWINVPPGTRASTYASADYKAAAPFAEPTLNAINAADTTHPTVQPVPYVGGQFVAIPEFQGIGTTVGQIFAGVLAGQTTVDDGLRQAQDVTTREMTKAGYIK